MAMAALPLTALDQKPKAMAVDQKPKDVRHGEFVEAIYDSIFNTKDEPYYLLPQYGRSKLFSMLGVMPDGYTITRYIYGTAKFWFPLVEDSVSWFGYIASRSDEEHGSPDVVVAIRGTLNLLDWVENLTFSMVPFEKVDSSAYVHEGFLSIYTSKDGSKKFGQESMMEQIEQELKRLADKASKESLKVTMTGHSLGAALATLAAAHIGAVKFSKQVKVSLCTFASPRVGDEKFKELVEGNAEEILRYTNVADQVPTLPPKWVPMPTGEWSFKQYTHVGTEVKLDWTHSPYVDLSTWNFILAHNLELYLHQLAAEPNHSIPRPTSGSLTITSFAVTVDNMSVDDMWKKNVGDSSKDVEKLESLKEMYKDDPESLHDYVQDVAYVAKKAKKAAKEEEAKSVEPLMKRAKRLTSLYDQPYGKRDYSLLNKGANILKSELKIPASWLVQPENKDMKLVNGKWLPRWKRPEEIPSPDNPDFHAEI